jgi:hypothetical protein
MAAGPRDLVERARCRPTACRASYQNTTLLPYIPPKHDIKPKIRPGGSMAGRPRKTVRALSGQHKGSCRGLRPSGGTAGDRGRPQPKPCGGNAAEMAVSKIMAPNRTLSLKFAPAAVWPHEAVRALSGQPKGSGRGPQPRSGTAGDRGRPY